jgi:hypothetical protein
VVPAVGLEEMNVWRLQIHMAVGSEEEMWVFLLEEAQASIQQRKTKKVFLAGTLPCWSGSLRMPIVDPDQKRMCSCCDRVPFHFEWPLFDRAE